MIFRVAKKMQFSAGHYLTGVPEGHPCRRQHGHNYEVVVVLEAVKLQGDMLLDFQDLSIDLGSFKRKWDHRNLNDFFENPTCEKIALEIFHHFEGLYDQEDMGLRIARVRVSEGPTSWAEVEG